MSRSANVAAALWVMLAASVAIAQDNPFARGFDAVPLKPTPLIDSGIALDGANGWTRKSVRAALLFDLSVDDLALREGDTPLGNLIPFRADAHLIAGYQVHQRFDVGVDLPLVVYQSSNFGLLERQGFPQPGVFSLVQPCGDFLARGCGLADVRVVPRVLVLDPDSFLFGLAVIPEVRIPIGDGLSFTGDRGWTVAPRLAAERTFGPVRVIANAGYRFRKPGQFLNLYVGNEFTFGAGAIYHLPDLAAGRLTHVDAIGEVHLATPTGAPFTFEQSDSLKTPLELLLGARARFFGRWGVELSVGRGIGVQSGYGHPDFRVMAGLRYDFEFRDRDGDGVADDVDGCPDVPEDNDGFEDDDGCPDPDNDRDGVLDVEDACPDLPGARELDGCPDRDGDEVPDNIDRCPDQAGPAENEGCPFTGPPFVELEPERLRLKANVLFETGQARIRPQSFAILDEVARVLKEHPEVGPVTIEGHTDNRGGAAYNRDLSTRRARAVLEYLVRKGIDRKRLRAKGYGEDSPIAPNDTPLGRAKNRRVEFTLKNHADILQEPGKQKSPVLVPAPEK
ncbi:MAG: OmpA family protein [Myxococcaceae bacterium]|nr:OmpA family protein [Myxococcaceae bacterium]